ncbi:MAG: DUF5684 domain-containing protein [Prochloraceae cyanobacterium]
MVNLLSYDLSIIYFIAQTSSDNSGGSIFLNLIFVLIGYIFSSFCFQKMLEKVGEPNAWFAWIPILNNWITYKAGGQSPWWIIGLFIPFVNFIAAIVLLIAFVNIINKINKNPWLILLMIIPLVNFWVMYHYAF